MFYKFKLSYIKLSATFLLTYFFNNACAQEERSIYKDTIITNKINSFLIYREGADSNIKFLVKIRPIVYDSLINTGVFKFRMYSSHANTFLFLMESGKIEIIEDYNLRILLKKIEEFLMRNEKFFNAEDKANLMIGIGNVLQERNSHFKNDTVIPLGK